MDAIKEQQLLERDLAALQNTASTLALRFIPDAFVRERYIRSCKDFSDGLLLAVKQKKMTTRAAAEQAQKMRNILMNTMRGSTSEFGLAIAQFLKKEGKTLAELEQKYASTLFNKEFKNLSPSQQNTVWCRIVQQAGPPQLRINNLNRWAGNAGRGFFALTTVIAVYHIAKAEDKLKATMKEGAVISGGLAGAGIVGPVGLACGPAAIACVPFAMFVGGFLGASGTDWLFERVWK